MTMLMKTVLIAIYVFGHANAWKYPLSALVLICGFIITIYHIYNLPFYTDITQVGYTFQGMFVLWTGFVLFLQVYMKDREGLSLLYFLGIPLMLGFSALLLNARYERVVSFTDKELTSSTNVGVLMKGLIRNFLGSYSLLHPLYIEQGDAFLLKKEEMLRSVQNALQLGVNRFPSEAKLRTLLGNFLAHVIENRVLAYSELDASEKLHPDLATRFTNRDLRTYLDIEIAKNLNKEIKAFTEFRAYKESADSQMITATKNLVTFWSELLSRTPRIEILAESAQIAYGAMQTSLMYYEKLLKINSQSIPVLRTYGRILLDIVHDPAEAGEILDRASRIERENALKVHNTIEADANARLNTLLRIVDEKLDIFDERHGVVIISVGAEQRGIIESCNGTWAKMFGYRSPNDLVGKNINTLQPEPISRHHNAYLSAYLEHRISPLFGKTILVLAKHQLDHIFPVDLYVRWSDEAKGKMVGVAKTLPSDHDVYLMLDSTTRMVAYASLSLYTHFGVSKRDVFARKVDLGTLLPCMRIIMNDEVDNSVLVEDSWRQMCTMKGFECEGVHVTTNRRMNVHAWITSLPMEDDTVIMVKFTVTQITKSLDSNLDSDSDDELQGHQSYVNRFDETDLGLDVVALTSDNPPDRPVTYAGSSSSSRFPASPALNTLTSRSYHAQSPGFHPQSPGFHAQSPFASVAPDDDAKLASGVASVFADPFSSRSLPINDKAQANRGTARGGPEVLDTMSDAGSARSPAFFPRGSSINFGNSASFRNYQTGMSGHTVRSVGQVNVQIGSVGSMASLGTHPSQVAARPHMLSTSARLTALPDDENKATLFSSPLLSPNPMLSPMLTPNPVQSPAVAKSSHSSAEFMSMRSAAVELPSKPGAVQEDDGRKRARMNAKKLRVVLAIQRRLVSKRMLIMNIVTFIALLILLAFSVTLYVLTTDVLDYNRLAMDATYNSGMRHLTMSDALTHAQAHYLMHDFPTSAPLFYRPSSHANNTYAGITSGVLSRLVFSMNLMRDYAFKADHANIRHSEWYTYENKNAFTLSNVIANKIVTYPESYKGMMAALSSQLHLAATGDMASQYFVLKNGLGNIATATEHVTKIAAESINIVNTDLKTTIIFLFVFSIVTVMIVMPLVVLPFLISTETEKSDVVSMLRQIPRNTRRTIRKQVQDVLQFLQDDDTVRTSSNEEEDEANQGSQDGEEDDEEQQQQGTHQKHNYGYAQNTLTAYERYMTRSTMMSARLQSPSMLDEWDPPSQAASESQLGLSRQNSESANSTPLVRSSSTSRNSRAKSTNENPASTSQGGVLSKALEQVGSMMMSARSLVPDARALSRSKQLTQKSGKNALFGANDEDAHGVDLAVLTHAVRRVAEDETNKLLIGNNGQIIQASENEDHVEMSKFQKIKDYVAHSRLLRSMFFKFIFFMAVMITYFSVLYVETRDTLQDAEIAALALRYATYRFPGIQYSIMLTRMNLLFDHPLLLSYRTFDPFLEIPNWTLYGVKYLQNLIPINAALVFSDPQLGLPYRVDEARQNRLLFLDCCSLQSEPFYTVFSPAIYSPNFFQDCPTVDLGAMKNGGYTVLTGISESLMILLSPQFYGLFKDYIDTWAPVPSQNLARREYALKLYHTLDVATNDYFIQLGIWVLDLYHDHARTVLDAIETLRTVFLILFIIAIFVMYFSIFRPIWTTLLSSLAQSRAMLTLVPPHMIENMPKMVAFMSDTMTKEL